MRDRESADREPVGIIWIDLLFVDCGVADATVVPGWVEDPNVLRRAFRSINDDHVHLEVQHHTVETGRYAIDLRWDEHPIFGDGRKVDHVVDRLKEEVTVRQACLDCGCNR